MQHQLQCTLPVLSYVLALSACSRVLPRSLFVSRALTVARSASLSISLSLSCSLPLGRSFSRALTLALSLFSLPLSLSRSLDSLSDIVSFTVKPRGALLWRALSLSLRSLAGSLFLSLSVSLADTCRPWCNHDRSALLMFFAVCLSLARALSRSLNLFSRSFSLYLSLSR